MLKIVESATSIECLRTRIQIANNIRFRLTTVGMKAKLQSFSILTPTNGKINSAKLETFCSVVL